MPLLRLEAKEWFLYNKLLTIVELCGSTNNIVAITWAYFLVKLV